MDNAGNDKFWSASVKTDTSVIVSVRAVTTLTTFSRVPCHWQHSLLYHVVSVSIVKYDVYILDMIKSSSWCEDVGCIQCDPGPSSSLDLNFWCCSQLHGLMGGVRAKLTTQQFLPQFDASLNGNKLFLNYWCLHFCDAKCWAEVWLSEPKYLKYSIFRISTAIRAANEDICSIPRQRRCFVNYSSLVTSQIRIYWHAPKLPGVL